MGDEDTFKLRRKGALSEKDLALLGGEYKIIKGRTRLIGDFKKDTVTKANADATFIRGKGRFTVKEVLDNQFYNMKKELQ